MNIPDTRASLLMRLCDHQDEVAWEEFVRLYHPIILRVATVRGLQPADAEDLAQKVLISVARSIENFDPHRKGARFRTWLRRVANNAVVNALTRNARDQAAGSEAERAILDQHPSDLSSHEQTLLTEYRRQLFLQAVEDVRDEFTETTWQAFWRTAVEGAAVEETAHDLGMTKGSVYAARGRVMRRMRKRVESYDQP